MASGRTVMYNIDFRAGALKVSSFFAGFSFLLLAVYYFGITNLKDCPGGEIILSMLLPMLILAVFIVLLGGFRYPVTPVYGFLGTAYCVFMFIRAFSYGNPLNTLLAMIWYLLAAAVYLCTALGYIPAIGIALPVMLLPVAVRLLFVDIRSYFLAKAYAAFLPEAAALSGLLAFGLLMLCLKPEPIKARERKRRDTSE